MRAPCCEKMGLKKGPWTIQEDQILIEYVTKYGHGNWRALPKLAGLLRCGKSCRLRWVNYLRPDIRRGNFSREEEEAIIELHEKLGNRWSVIAARLPGRTDNEIKNVWHTHLKKRLLKQNHTKTQTTNNDHITKQEQEFKNYSIQAILVPESPQNSAITDTSANSINDDALENYFPEVDENFWLEVFPRENTSITSSDFPINIADDFFYDYNNSSMYGDGANFWYNLFTSGVQVAELPEF